MCSCLGVKQRKYPYFYQRHKLKHATGFVSAPNLVKLKQLAKDADKSLTRYVSRILEKHIEDVWKLRSKN
jgi:hypothetical protein